MPLTAAMPEAIDREKVVAVMQSLYPITQGPREMFGILVACLHVLNDKIVSVDQKLPINEYAECVSYSLLTLRSGRSQ